MSLSIRIFFTGFLLFVSTSLIWGQDLPPNQPEQDCFGALRMCDAISSMQDTFVQFQPYSGLGLNEDEITLANSCISKGAAREAWYLMTIEQSGSLCFTITSLDSLNDDYDWAIFNLTNATCQDIVDGTIQARGVSDCNFGSNQSGCGGRTGANGITTGPCADQSGPCLTVTQGEVYVLNVTYFSPRVPVSGYTIDFAGSTASILDTEPPELDFVDQDCGSNTITVEFSENVVCSSVTPSDFSITGPDGIHTVTRVIKPDCDQGFSSFADSFTLEIQPPITQTGQYNVSLVDEVLDVCGNVAQLPNSRTLSLNPPPVQISASPEILCEGDTTTLQVSGLSNPADFQIIWTPGNLTGESVQVSPSNTTTYFVDILNQQGCLIYRDSQEVEVLPIPTSAFTLPTQVCTGSPAVVTFTGFDPTGNSIYSWEFGSATQLSGSNQGPIELVWDDPGTQTVSLQVDASGCLSEITSATIEVFLTPTAEVDVPDASCESEPIEVVYTGTASAGANYDWNFVDAIAPAVPTGPGPHIISFDDFGPRTLELTVSENGCDASASFPITINQPPVAEIGEVQDQCLNSNEFNFFYDGPNTNLSQLIWDFGDGNGSTEQSPTHVYATSGQKIVQLGVADVNGCTATGADTIFVFDEPIADFEVEDGCMRQRISFTNLSTTPSSASIGRNEWDYGDGTNSIQINPTHRFLNSGTFPVSLTVFTENGCSDDITKEINVFPTPDADFDVRNVCLEDTTAFQDLSVITPLLNDQLNTWNWDLGDGTTQSGITNFVHTYTTTGTFRVKLVVGTDNGCLDSLEQTVTIFPSSQPLIADNDTVCFGEPAQLNVSGSADGSTVNWYNTPTDSLPFFIGATLVTDPLVENQFFTAQAISPQGCISEFVEVGAEVLPQGEGEIFASSEIVEIPSAVVNFSLIGNIIGQEFSWSFGDGETSSADQPAHEFQFSGKYNVTADIIDVNGCLYTFNKVIEVIKLVNVFAPTAFSPNGDGINDEFFIASSLVRQFEVTIFNRWGEAIYESEDPDFKWDGSLSTGGTAPEGVYVYKVRIQDIEGDILNEKGTLTLVR